MSKQKRESKQLRISSVRPLDHKLNATSIVEYVLSYVAASGRIEGRGNDKSVTFIGGFLDPKAGTITPIKTAVVDSVANMLKHIFEPEASDAPTLS